VAPHALGVIVEGVAVEAGTLDEKDARRVSARPILMKLFFMKLVTICKRTLNRKRE